MAICTSPSRPPPFRVVWQLAKVLLVSTMACSIFFSFLLVLQAALSVVSEVSLQRVKTQADVYQLLRDDEIFLGRLLVGRRDKTSKLNAVGCINKDGGLAPVDSVACNAFMHAVCKASASIFEKRWTEPLMNLTVKTPEGVLLLSNTMPWNLCGILEGRLACNKLVASHGGFPPHVGPIAVRETFPLLPRHCENSMEIVPKDFQCCGHVDCDANKEFICSPQFLNAGFDVIDQRGPITFRGLPPTWGTDALPRTGYGTPLFPQVGSKWRKVNDLLIFWDPAPVE